MSGERGVGVILMCVCVCTNVLNLSWAFGGGLVGGCNISIPLFFLLLVFYVQLAGFLLGRMRRATAFFAPSDPHGC